MKIVAIIAEYNPFHNGHKYQIDSIRRLMGEDCSIIALMSGNFTQRGELAIADKSVRAESAVECGVDLVLELPFPYSMSSAEFFAGSGVHIINALGVVDFLAFGSECGDTGKICRIARNMLSEKYKSALTEPNESDKGIGYPALCESAYRRLYGSDIDGFFSPNNTLALEYVKALLREDSQIIPLTIKREGSGYNDSFSPEKPIQSASAIRAMIQNNELSALNYVPKIAKNIYLREIDNQKMPTEQSLLDAAVISHFRLNPPENQCDIHDASGGLYNRLCDYATEATSISSLTSMTETKKYTKARIRRAIWNSYLGVTSSDVRELPAYTQVLAMNDKGRSILKRIKKMSDFPVITKPADYREYYPAVTAQKELSNRADSVFALARKLPNSGNFSITRTPYVKI